MRATEDMNGYHALKREQAFNRMFRHCRIGKVKRKFPKGPSGRKELLDLLWLPDPNDPRTIRRLTQRT